MAILRRLSLRCEVVVRRARDGSSSRESVARRRNHEFRLPKADHVTPDGGDAGSRVFRGVF